MKTRFKSLTAVLIGLGLLVPVLVAPPVAAAQGRGDPLYQFELHWGFVHTLGPDSGDPALLLPFDGRVSISDGDASTTEGVHLISALLFETGGAYEKGRADSVTEPRDQCWAVENAGLYCPWIAWRSATTSDWDGIAFTFRWVRGTDPVVRFETSQSTWEAPMSRLQREAGLRDLGPQSQQLETGQFFTRPGIPAAAAG